ncbi:hypothetical protein M2447_001582 [Ereboglobus sp. PH5-10]|uniref:hypothetical protein n=1 Tax=Ereboglobus sp. PH5-10 TaxID=2940629 RepID=UPI0024071A1A|nr:hypothetical protein [Ereboglobus sp. PH5-10]MDF9827489.1 hypothetical protein [Ereboglobus sp. PH5-10]
MKSLRYFSGIILVAALACLCGCDQLFKARSRGSETVERKSGKHTVTTGSKKSAKPSAAKTKDKAESDAIEFHNILYGVLAAANKPLEKISKEMTESVSDAHRDHLSDRTRWRSLRGSGLGKGFPKIPGFDLKPPEAFSSEDKEFFNAGITTVRDSVREIIALIDELETYYAAEDYKDDWFKKVYMTAPRMEALIATIRDASDPLRERVDEITDEIDARNVAKIPVGQWVLNMRGFMKKYRAMTACLLRAEFADPSHGTGITPEQRRARIAAAEEWAAKAEALCAELDELAAEQRAHAIADYEGSRYEKIYHKFYAEYDESKIVIRRVLRGMREKGSIYDQNSIKSDQRDIARHLGEFVRLWNEKGSRGK